MNDERISDDVLRRLAAEPPTWLVAPEYVNSLAREVRESRRLAPLHKAAVALADCDAEIATKYGFSNGINGWPRFVKAYMAAFAATESKDSGIGGRVERQRAVNPPVSGHGGCESHPDSPSPPPAAAAGEAESAECVANPDGSPRDPLVREALSAAERRGREAGLEEGRKARMAVLQRCLDARLAQDRAEAELATRRPALRKVQALQKLHPGRKVTGLFHGWADTSQTASALIETDGGAIEVCFVNDYHINFMDQVVALPPLPREPTAEEVIARALADAVDPRCKVVSLDVDRGISVAAALRKAGWIK